MKLNIGCGKRNFGQKWVHIDGANFSHIDSNDISLESFKNDSVDLIYSSHFIEYFDRDEIISLLKMEKSFKEKWYS